MFGVLGKGAGVSPSPHERPGLSLGVERDGWIAGRQTAACWVGRRGNVPWMAGG